MKQKQTRWLEKISQNVQELGDPPLFGRSPSLNWEEIASSLGKQLGIEDFTLRVKRQEWKEKEDLKKGLGNEILINPVTISPIASSLFWVMSQADRDKLTANILSEKPKKKAFSSSALQEGYYRFLLLIALNVLQGIDPIHRMTLQLEEERDLDEEVSLCIDIEISFGHCTCWGRLILPNTFRKYWVQHFAAFPTQYIPSSLSQKLPIEVGFRIGSVSLSQKQWSLLKPGDIVIPDAISDNEHPRKGTLHLGSSSLFQATIDSHSIKLIDYAFTTEDSMQESNPLSTDPLSRQLEIAEKESKEIKDIPLDIQIEMVRVKMTLDELMHLSPGDTLSLPSYADQKVSLLVNGEKIGVAELVYLGETLGLKILEI